MNLILLQHGYPIAIIKNEERGSYIDSIAHAHQGGDDTNFLLIVCQAVESNLDLYLEAIEQSEH